MCFDTDSQPPIPILAGAAVDGKRIELTAADGTRFAAFSAQPSAPTGAAMLILPDVRGLYHFYEELALRFAEAGIAALTIDYFGRTAGVAPRPPDFDYQPHISQVSFESLLLDVQAGRDELLRSSGARGLFSIGFCFGGRLSLVLASRPGLGLSAATAFYGWPVGESRGLPAPIDLVSSAAAPILALFGGADQGIPAEAVEAYRAALAGAGVEHDVVVYPDAPHSFFDRKAADFAAASSDAWGRVLEFVKQHTPAA